MGEGTQKDIISWCRNCKVPFFTESCGICGNSGESYAKTLKPIFCREREILDDANEKSETKISKMRDRLLFRSNLFIFDQNGNFAQIKVDSANSYNISLKMRKTQVKCSQKAIPSKESLKPNQFDFLINVWDGSTPFEQRILQANFKQIQIREQEAIEFIKATAKKYSSKDYRYLISFSGGKDSLVVSDLVRTALSLEKCSLFFSNTGIELPQTVEFVHQYAKKFNWNLIEVKSPNEFFSLCKELGVPSRQMRWCCTTQKSMPISEYYSNLGKLILSFDGIRRDESNTRREYERIQHNTKIPRQYSCYPILDWSEFEVWLYILYKRLPFNPAYLYGLGRVGCWACPNNGTLDFVLMKYIIPKEYDRWIKLLEEYGQKIGRGDDYVYSGSWRRRRTYYLNQTVASKTSPCVQQNEVLYNFTQELPPNIGEFLKIFASKTKDSLEFEQFTGKYLTVLLSRKRKMLKVNFNKEFLPKHYKYRFERQLLKALNCVNCGGCVGVCPQGAINVQNTLTIDHNKCNQCLLCTTGKFLHGSCVALHYKSERKWVENGFSFHHAVPQKSIFRQIWGFSPKLTTLLEENHINEIGSFLAMNIQQLKKTTKFEENLLENHKILAKSCQSKKMLPFVYRNGSEDHFDQFLNTKQIFFVTANLEKDSKEPRKYNIISKEIKCFNDEAKKRIDWKKSHNINKKLKEPIICIFETNQRKTISLVKDLENKFNRESLTVLNLFDILRKSFAFSILKNEKDKKRKIVEQILTNASQIETDSENDRFLNKMRPFCEYLLRDNLFTSP